MYSLNEQQTFSFIERQTFSLEMLHSIEVFITRCVEMLLIEKDEASAWIQRMHSCLNCYKEFLFTLKTFEKKKRGDGDEHAAQTSYPEIENGFDCVNDEANMLIKKIQNQIFYVQETRELFINVLKDFNESKITK